MEKSKKIRNICKFGFVIMILMLCLNYRWNFVYASSADETVAMNKESLVMYIGSSEQLKVNGSSGVFVWESLDKEVASVDENGNVTAVGIGNTHIIAKGYPKSYICYVIVKEPEINKKAVTVYPNGITEQLNINGIKDETIVWKSENEKIAKVTSLGEVIGISVGKTKVVAKVGSESYFCDITVKEPYISEKKIDVKVGENHSISVMGSKGKVTYKTADKSIATVTQDGTIVGVNEGNTSVVAIYNGIKYYTKVTVTQSRLNTDAEEVWMNKDKVITITLKNRQKNEDISIEDSKGIIDIKRGNWKGDTISLTLTPKKDGITDLIIKRKDSNDILKIKVHVSVRRLLTAEEIYKQYVNASVSIISYDAVGDEKTGSGFFIDSGVLVTNYHVIEYANNIEVVDINGKNYKVKAIYDYDVTSDLALLEVEKTNDAIFYINSEGVKTGETIYTFGSPVKYIGTISEGMISYANRVLEGVHYIQITAPISQSSGGGPLINCYGEVIGINTLTVPSAQNINLSVKIGYLKRLNVKNKREIEKFYEENKDKVMDTGFIEIIIG